MKSKRKTQKNEKKWGKKSTKNMKKFPFKGKLLLTLENNKKTKKEEKTVTKIFCFGK